MASVQMHAVAPIDLTSLFPAPTKDLDQSYHAVATCLHPNKPLLGVAAATTVAVFDLLSNCRLGRVDLRVPAVEMCFSPDGSQLVVVLQDTQIMGVSLATWRSHVIVPRRPKADKPLEACLLAVSAGARACVYFCKYGKDVLRCSPLTAAELMDSKGRLIRDKDGNWGTKIKVDFGTKPLIGMAAHPTEYQLVMLHTDGVLRGYGLPSPDVLVLQFSLQVQEAFTKLPAPGSLLITPHPSLADTGLAVQTTRLGDVNVVQLAAGGGATPLLRARMQGCTTLLGAGVLRDCGQVVSFGMTEAGRVRTAAWSLNNSLLVPIKVEPMELNPLLAPWTPLGQRQAGGQSPQPPLPLGHTADKVQGESAAALWGATPSWAQGPAWPTLLAAPQLGPVTARALVHTMLPLVALQLEPSLALQASPGVLNTPLGMLGVEEYALARKGLSVPLLVASSWEGHAGGGAGHWPAASPAHASLAAWSPSSPLGGGGALQLPGHVYFITQNSLCKYSLATRATSVLAALPIETPDGGRRQAVSMSVSRSGAWLIFFDTHGCPQGGDRYQWTVILPGTCEGGAAPVVWFKPGKYGAFVGPEDAHFVVVESTGRLAAVFATSLCSHAHAAPLYTFSLEGVAVGGPAALPLFPGPPQDPVLDTTCTAVVGCVLWQTAQGALAGRPLPELVNPELAAPPAPPSVLRGAQYDDVDSDDEEGMAAATEAAKVEAAEAAAASKGPPPQGTGAVAPGSHLGSLGYKMWLPLQPGEVVLSVAWQSLGTPEGTLSAVEAGRGAVLGAVLTTQRVMLVTASLRVHACMVLSDHITTAAPRPATSLLWAGPALLVLLVDGRVVQLAMGGRVLPVCSMAGGLYTQLVGAAPDHLLLVRAGGAVAAQTGMRGGGASMWEVVARPASLLQPLVVGWASLGLVVGGPGVAAVRTQLREVLRLADPTPLTPSSLWALMAACAADLAAALASHTGSAGQATLLASSAAAGQWATVAGSLAIESERGAIEGTPPRGSPTHAKLLAAAGGAVAHGQLHVAVGLLQSAGEWAMALVVAAARGDSGALHKVAAAASGKGELAAQMASALSSLYGKSVITVADPEMKLEGPGGEALVPAASWVFGSMGTLLPATAVVPAAYKAAAFTSETAPLNPMNANNVASLLALDAASTQALSMRSVAVAQALQSVQEGDLMMATGSSKAGTNWGGALEAPSAGSQISLAADSLFTGSRRGDTTATPRDPQEAARGDFLNFDSPFNSDSDSEAESQAPKYKVKLVIGAPVAAAPAHALRMAMQGVRLSPPPPPGGASTVGAGQFAGLSPALATGIFGAGGGGGTTPGMPPPLPSGMFGGEASPMYASGVFEGPGGGGPGAVVSPALTTGLSLPITSYPSVPVAPANGVSTAGLSPALALGMAAPAGPPPSQRGGPPGISTSGLSPALAAGMVPPAAQPSSPQVSLLQPVGSVGSADELYHGGVMALENGDWSGATARFSRAMALLRGNAAASGKVSFCALYLAACQLLARASVGPRGPHEARLYRYASALPLDNRHRWALAREAVTRNKEQGNFRYCGELLTWLVGSMAGSVPDGALVGLQEAIEECDRAKGADKSVPKGEELEMFAQLASSCMSNEDVGQLVTPLIQGLA